MTKDERIQGLIEANNRNTEKRCALATALREIYDELPMAFRNAKETIDLVLKLNGPE